MPRYFTIDKWIGPDYVDTLYLGDFEVKNSNELLEYINADKSYLFSITEWDRSSKDQDAKIIRQLNAEKFF